MTPASPCLGLIAGAQHLFISLERVEDRLQDLITAIPDVDVLLRLEPEELGAKLLFLIRGRVGTGLGAQFHPGNFQSELWDSVNRHNQQGYPRTRDSEVGLALAEAYGWLEAQGLIVQPPGMNGNNGWKVLSRRAIRFENEREFANYTVARHLPHDALHPAIAGSVWMSFMREEFDTAVFQAMKAVEVEVREASGLTADDVGTKLMRKAFAVDDGPLSDLAAERSERQAMGDLFAGAIGTFKNPQSHRNVSLNNPAQAAEIVLFASHLLRIVDGARCRATGSENSGSAVEST